jgi:hypothetical protein
VNTASQHSPLADCSCTRAGSARGNGGSGGMFPAFPPALIFAFPAAPALSVSLSIPLGVRWGSLYLKPVVPG